MTNSSARTVAVVAMAGTVAGAVAASSPASATPPPAYATLDCGEGHLVSVNTNKGNAFRVIDTTQNFVIMSGSIVNSDGTTTLIQAPNGTQMTRDLVTCTFTGPLSGRNFVVSGFFTPAM